jgi:predicted PurR-regulated permease PerM
MGNPGLEFSTAANWSKITEALNYGKTHLDKKRFDKVNRAYKKFIVHTLICIVISAIVGGGITIAGKVISDSNQQKLLASYGATNWKSGVRVNAATVQYTQGQTYTFDTSTVGVDLDTDFPGQRGLILLLNDENALKGIISKDAFNKLNDIFAYGVVFGLIIGIVILVVFYLYYRKHSPNAKIWYIFMRWADTGNPDFLNEIDQLISR